MAASARQSVGQNAASAAKGDLMEGNGYSVVLKPISRDKFASWRQGVSWEHGRARSVVAKAAYDTRDKIYDVVTEEWHDFRHKGKADAIFTQLPKNAPKAWRDCPALLAQEMAMAEDRVDAQEGFSLRYALPFGLTPTEYRQLAKNIAERTASDQQLAAIVSLHLEPNNPHVHQIISTRFVSERGFGQKYRRIRQKGYLYDTREAVAQECARMLGRAAKARPKQAEVLERDAARWEHGHQRYEKQVEEALKRGDKVFALHCTKRLDDFKKDKSQRTRAKWSGVKTRRKEAAVRRMEISREIKRDPDLLSNPALAPAPTNERPARPARPVSRPDTASSAPVVVRSTESLLSLLLTELAGLEQELARLKSIPEKQWNHAEIERTWAAIIKKRREIENEKAAQKEKLLLNGKPFTGYSLT